MKEEMSPFFVAVAELAENRGFEVDGVKGGALQGRKDKQVVRLNLS